MGRNGKKEEKNRLDAGRNEKKREGTGRIWKKNKET